MTACIGEPISWLKLETFALGAPDPAIASHVAACPVCRQCLDQIRGDVVALPPLAVPARSPSTGGRWRRRWLAPAFAFAAAAVVLVIVLRRPPPTGGEVATVPPGIVDVVSIASIKGIGEVTLELVRERAGAIRYDASSYAPGDRWKVVVTCPPGAVAQMMSIDVSVADGATTDHPLAPAQLPCGNRVVVPGAFTVTGARNNQVCVSVAAAPDAGAADAGTACLTLHPE